MYIMSLADRSGSLVPNDIVEGLESQLQDETVCVGVQGRH